ncbi:MAG: LCP family protein, partial [Anaerolineales bacterium]|nr:LCP family protein [Anaerolineales bacterium]
VMQVYSSQPKKTPDRIKRGLWAAFLLSALLTTVLAIRGATKNNGSPQLTLEDIPLSAIPLTGDPIPTLPEDQMLQGNSNRPGSKELNLDQPVYFLLTGLDKREWEGDTGPGLTDTILVGFLDAQKQTAGLISIPRDTWVEVPGYSPYKINQTFSVGEATGYPGGGPALLMETAGNLLGTPIDFYIQVDFEAFVVLVDSVDGVMVNVKENILVDPDPSVKGDMKKLLPGERVLPGDLALGYVRTRSTAEGDFGRTKRQQQVLVGLQKKIFSYEILPVLIPKIPGLYRDLFTHVETNLTFSQLVNLAWTVRDINPQNLQTRVINQPLVEAGFNTRDQYVLFPDIERIQKVWSDMQHITATPVPEPTREITLDEYLQEENAKVAVLNGTTSPGLAGETATFLLQNGFQVTEVGNSDKFKEQTAIYDYSGKPYTVQAILNIMSYSQTRLYHRSDPDSNVDIVILLGADWVTENTLQDPE